MNGTYNQSYLIPTRDIPEYSDWMKTVLKFGGGVTLVGKDLDILIERLTRPDRFWKRFKIPPRITIWIAATPKSEFVSVGRLMRDTEASTVGKKEVLSSLNTAFIVPDNNEFPYYLRIYRGLWTHRSAEWFSRFPTDTSNLEIIFYDKFRPIENDTESHARLDVGPWRVMNPFIRTWEQFRIC